MKRIRLLLIAVAGVSISPHDTQKKLAISCHVMEKITTFGVRFLNGYKEDKKDTINIF